MTEPDISIAMLIARYREYRAKQVPTLLSVLKLLRSQLRSREGRNAGTGCDWLTSVPAARLYGLLKDNRAQWRPEVASGLPSGSSYQQAYPRAVRRLLVFGEEAGLLHPDHYTLSPKWRALLRKHDRRVHDDSVQRKVMARWSLRRLARWASSVALEPDAIPVVSTDGRVMGAFRDTFPREAASGFYQARRAWNQMAEVFTEQGLRPWDADRRDLVCAIPQARWPPVLQDGFHQFVDRGGLGGWRDETKKGYVLRISGYLGALSAVGIDMGVVLAQLTDGKDAIRLLFQGLPSPYGELTASGVGQLMTTSPERAGQLLADLRDLDGNYDGRAAVENPLLMAAVRHFVAKGRVTTATDLLKKAAALNRSFLNITDRHVAWTAPRLRELEMLARRKPSDYVRKKRGVFRQPEMWRDLVVARSRLRAHTRQLEDKGRIDGRRNSAVAGRRWAIALRNEIIFGLLLAYPLRVANLVAIRLGQHYLPEDYTIRFDGTEVKNEKEIDYELPDGGSLGDLRGLIDQYLCEARPLLCAGRPTDYLFVPDPRGGARMRSRAVNVILVDISHRFLVDVLPPGVEAINPHLMRHAAASYQLAVRHDPNLAAQILNISPATVTSSYADILENRKEATKRFLSSFEV